MTAADYPRFPVIPAIRRGRSFGLESTGQSFQSPNGWVVTVCRITKTHTHLKVWGESSVVVWAPGRLDRLVYEGKIRALGKVKEADYA